MKGSNTLKVCQVTLCEMVQFYVDHKMPLLGEVERVAESDRMTHEFEIRLKERETPLIVVPPPPSYHPHPGIGGEVPDRPGATYRSAEYVDDGLGPTPDQIEPPPPPINAPPERELRVVKRRLKE